MLPYIIQSLKMFLSFSVKLNTIFIIQVQIWHVLAGSAPIGIAFEGSITERSAPMRSTRKRSTLIK